MLLSAVMDTINENNQGLHGGGGEKYAKAKMFDMKLLSESIDQGIGGSSNKQDTTTLEDALYSLKSTLEDYQGQYPELQKLELQIRKLDKLLKVTNLNRIITTTLINYESSLCSNVSLKLNFQL